MYVKTVILILTVITQCKLASAIECFSCSNATHLPDCSKTISCPANSICSSKYDTFQGQRVYTLGCQSIWDCPVHTTVSTGGSSSSIIGRAVTESGNCSDCCTTSHCNRQLCQSADPYCNDDHDVNCEATGTRFNLCGDESHAKVNCRRFCGYCNTVDGGWTSWAEWSACDVTCANGTRSRSRACTDPPPANGGSDCPGDKLLHESCTKPQCPVHGGWSQWSDWGSCSVSCDIGLQRRDRTCSSPYPGPQGDHCYGDSRADRMCSPGPCANGSWSSWSAWGSCDRTCDGGVKTRTRNCDNPAPSLTGNYCDGETTEAGLCNFLPCQDGGWSSWGAWGSCDKTCDGGVRTRTRTCDNPLPSLTGKYCPGSPFLAESCNVLPCQGPVVFYAKDLSTLSPGKSAVLRFTHVPTNVGNAYNSSTGYFIAPTSGTYSFDVQFCGNTNYYAGVGLFINGSRYQNLLSYNADSYACRTLSVNALLTKGDTVQCRTDSSTTNGQAFHSDGNNINAFSGALIRV